MRIWFDLSNSPHINLFAGMIRDLQREHEVVITCRPLANTIDMLELHKLPYNVVGKHYGANIFMKVLGYPIRVLQLYAFLRKKKPDVAISQSSFHSPLVARLLGVRSIYTNDNEHAMGNIPAFLCARLVLIPEFLDRRRVRSQGAWGRKLLQYPGVKEGIYLWDFKAFRAPGERTGPTTIYVRPEPWAAQYYTGKVNFMDELLLGLQHHARVILLPRGEVQAKHYRSPEFAGLTVVDGVKDLIDIVPTCDLFIGAGGTMTREMAVLGVPTISVYQSELLDVDRYLLQLGRLIHKPDLTAEFVRSFISQQERMEPNRDVLDRGRKAYEMFKTLILKGEDRDVVRKFQEQGEHT